MIKQDDLFTGQRCGSISQTPLGVVEVVLAGRAIEAFETVAAAIAWAEQCDFIVQEASAQGVLVADK